jgi:ATP-dependent Clp protease adapter protein ClpS
MRPSLIPAQCCDDVDGVRRQKGTRPIIGDAALNEQSPNDGYRSGREETVEQPMCRVLLVNDDATPMDFVIRVVRDVFRKPQKDAVRIMLITHYTGAALCGVYARHDAESLVERVADLARQNDHRLRCRLEPAGDFAFALREWRKLTCQGSLADLPAFVLEAGAGCTRDNWRLLQTNLGRRTLVVSYDRAGLGWNTEWALDVSASGVAARLATLLAQSSIPPPYVLIGHSLGGLFVQYYAARHPGDVAGLVLVDATDTDYSSHAPVLRHFAPGGRLWDPFSDPSREMAAIGTTQILVGRRPIAREVPMLTVSAGTWPEQPESPVPPAELRRLQASMIENHRKIANQSNFGRHVLMPKADHTSLLSNREHATELAEHILDFAETFCRVRPTAGKSADI